MSHSTFKFQLNLGQGHLPFPEEKQSNTELSTYSAWVKNLPTAPSNLNPIGGRNNVAFLLVAQGFATNQTEETIEAELRSYCEKSGLPFEEVTTMIGRVASQHQIKNFQSRLENPKSKKLKPAILAEIFLKHWLASTADENCKLVFWRDNFFFYTGTHYEGISRSELKAKLVSFLRSRNETKERFSRSTVEEVISHLTGIRHIPFEIEPGSSLKTEKRNGYLVSLRNQILRIDLSLPNCFETISHDPQYFLLGSLPYDFTSSLSFPNFQKVLNEILPDQECQTFFQEWAGYNLIPDTSMNKFLVIVGEGANGKSVLTTVLTALLGTMNVSAVPLECFTPIRTFPLWSTIGKLANIVDEMGAIEKLNEAILKQFVSGSKMNIERKGVDGVDQTPTARLTFATNCLPKFNDSTDGLWRRLILMPMNFQILDESKQDRRLTDVNFWHDSQELSGILHWALRGLVNLLKRSHFVEPSLSLEYKSGYRKDSDWAGEYLEQNVIEDPLAQTGVSSLFSDYCHFGKAHGFPVVSAHTFARGVFKKFPKVTRSSNARRVGGRRERVWIGISLIGGSL